MVLLFVAMQCSIMTEFLLILCISNNMINIKDVNMNNKMLFGEFKRVQELCMQIYVTQVIHFFLQQMQPSYQHELPKKVFLL